MRGHETQRRTIGDRRPGHLRTSTDMVSFCAPDYPALNRKRPRRPLDASTLPARGLPSYSPFPQWLGPAALDAATDLAGRGENAGPATSFPGSPARREGGDGPLRLPPTRSAGAPHSVPTKRSRRQHASGGRRGPTRRTDRVRDRRTCTAVSSRHSPGTLLPRNWQPCTPMITGRSSRGALNRR